MLSSLLGPRSVVNDVTNNLSKARLIPREVGRRKGDPFVCWLKDIFFVEKGLGILKEKWHVIFKVQVRLRQK